MARRRTIDEILEAARRSYSRVTAVEAKEAVDRGAVLVDIRSEDVRRRDGVVPGSLHHPLSVLYWRLDPDVPTSNPKLSLETEIVLLCREGFSSSIAAAVLVELGFASATDVIGGFDAWKEAGLPVEAHPGAT